eukprot:8723589-Ditylum_brightwellii.AAC.1
MTDEYNKDKPFIFSKLDVKDGFWRLVVNKEDAWNFCYILPPKDGTEPTCLDMVEIVVPASIQMGWSESPSYFCSGAETARDTIQILADDIKQLPFHQLETKMLPAKYAEEQEHHPSDKTMLE